MRESRNLAKNSQTISNIIRYWNSEMLCSPESSTSHADPDLVYLDNVIEKRVLNDILTCHIQETHRRCLDVGAGYGRFVPIFKKFYAEIVLLEAAKKIYKELHSLWQNSEGVSCHSRLFESFTDEQKFDLIFASGVLYLYDDDMLHQFLKKSRTMLAKTGLLILRDFVSEPSQVTKSTYVENGFCHYRSSQFWAEVAQVYDLDLIEVQRSKPRLSFLRNHRIYGLFRRFRLTSVLRHSNVANIAMKLGEWQQYASHEVQTVYLIMRVI